jgi:transposase
MLAELRRDMERRRLISDQIRQIEDARQERIEQAPGDGQNVMVRLLAQVIGVGIETADMLVQEVLARTCATAGPSHVMRASRARPTRVA